MYESMKEVCVYVYIQYVRREVGGRFCIHAHERLFVLKAGSSQVPPLTEAPGPGRRGLRSMQ